LVLLSSSGRCAPARSIAAPLCDAWAIAAPPRKAPRLARVESVGALTPTLVRIVFGGEGLTGFEAGEFTDHYVKLQLPPPGASYGTLFDLERVRAELPKEEWPRVRSYTVSEWDAERGLLTIDFVVHGEEGVAGPWAAAAEPGDVIQLRGPGGAYAPDPEADWHLMAGDTSVIPAIAAALGRVPAGRPVHVFFQVDGPEEELRLSSPGDLRLQWLHGGGDETLAEVLAALEFPPGRVHAFLHGEATSVRLARRHLAVERGIPKEDLSASGYWKRSRSDEGWREEKAEWNRQVEAEAARA
jgi:NADPH-dependent ferric siderophore reductase